MQLLKDLVLVYTHGSQKCIYKVSEPAREVVVLESYEYHQFFKGFWNGWNWGFFDSEFFFQELEPTILWSFNF